MLRLDKSVMVLELKVHFPNYKNYILEYLFPIETKLNAEMWQINLLE